MKEAKERDALIEDIDPPTFARFGQYVYTGTYQAAEHELLLGAESIGEDTRNELREGCRESVPEVAATEQDPFEDGVITSEGASVETQDPWGSFAVTAKKSTKLKKDRKKATQSMWDEPPPPSPVAADEPQYMNSSPGQSSGKLNLQERRKWEEFTAREYDVDSQEDIAQARANAEPCEEYTEVFLSHARIYIFADRYSIEALKQLTLRRLHQTLVKFTLYEERIPDITCLLSFSYNNTPDRTGTVDELRLLVVKYISCHIKRIHSDTSFVHMMKAEGPLSIDLLQELI